MAIAITDSNFFNLDNFATWDNLCNKIDKINGVDNIISVNKLSKLVKDTAEQKFEIKSWFPKNISSQEILDSLVLDLDKQKFYDGIFSDNNLSLIHI